MKTRSSRNVSSRKRGSWGCCAKLCCDVQIISIILRTQSQFHILSEVAFRLLAQPSQRTQTPECLPPTRPVYWKVCLALDPVFEIEDPIFGIEFLIAAVSRDLGVRDACDARGNIEGGQSGTGPVGGGGVQAHGEGGHEQVVSQQRRQTEVKMKFAVIYI